jgi:eukaryotic-like serine/threonine-protein kinase
MNKIILTLNLPQGQTQTFTYDRPTICTIGRDRSCEIQINDSSISSQHCQLNINPPQITIKDLGSTFGTEIHRISQAKIPLTPQSDRTLNPGDKIILSRGAVNINVEVEINGRINTPQVIHPQPKPANNPLIKKENWWQTIKNIFGINEHNLTSKKILSYQIIQKITETHLSEIYLVIHEQTQEQVILKVMSSEIKSDVKKTEIFKREIENTRALNHPNIVKFKDQGWAEDLIFFVLEYCDQGSVYDLMQKDKKPLSIRESIEITLQILDALIYAHEVEVPYVKLADGSYKKGKGVIHRDIKPENILLKTENGKIVAKLADFGLSKAMNLAGLTQLTNTGQLKGSLQFMCRKQVHNPIYSDPSMDVWGVIACFYYMLTGNYPRDFSQSRKDPLTDVLIVMQNPALPIHSRNCYIPHDLAKLIDEGLKENPDPLFQNARAFKTALTNVSRNISY